MTRLQLLQLELLNQLHDTYHKTRWEEAAGIPMEVAHGAVVLPSKYCS